MRKLYPYTTLNSNFTHGGRSQDRSKQREAAIARMPLARPPRRWWQILRRKL